MKKFFKSVGAFFKNNYWLTPLLLVAVVFVLVFSLEGLEDVVDTIKGWFSPNSRCSACENVRVIAAREELVVAEHDEKVYIYYYDKEEQKDNTFTANAALNRFIKSYNKDLKADGKEKVTVYAVNYGVEEYGEVSGEITEFADSKMTKELYETISEEVRVYYAENNPSLVSGKGVGEYTITCPMLIEYSYDSASNSFVVSNVLKGNDNFSQVKLKSFFNGTFQD